MSNAQVKKTPASKPLGPPTLESHRRKSYGGKGGGDEEAANTNYPRRIGSQVRFFGESPQKVNPLVGNLQDLRGAVYQALKGILDNPC